MNINSFAVFGNVYHHPKNVVITGGSRGIGKSLAKSFLSRGHNVLITSRNECILKDTVNELKKTYPVDNIGSISGDVSDYSHCENVKELAISQFGVIDIWINNAGTNCFCTKPFDEFSEESFREIVETNIIGTLNGSKVMIETMRSQNKGILVNMEGAGSNGFATPNHAVYGMSKQAITHFTKSLIKEHILSDFYICSISPGMVLTDILLKDSSNENLKWVFNTICEDSDFVSEFLTERILNISKHEQIRYLTVFRIIWLVGISLFRRHRHFDKYGNKRV
tara:strand:- start:388 stop:1227 length:840 start_codon:yes stop_codon:yes gene_type:complete